ncbi:MAG: TonB family protein [Bacteroidaceae bacterium]|nr:TonB family protein [Bacteroidaceae bacterium]
MQAIITATAIYALKAAIALALLYTPYIFFMRRETHFRTNRTTLLLAMILSLVTPFIDIPALHIENPFANEKPEESVTFVQTDTQQTTITVQSAKENIKSLTPEEKAYYFLCLPYIIIALIIVAKKSYELYTIKRHIRRGTLWREEKEGYTIYCHASTTTPYSWMKSIVISQEDYEKFGKEIILHEEGHILHRHSWDMLLLTAAESLQWFNPFIHMLATDLKDIHEFQADAHVLQKGQNSKEYQMLIIKKAVSHASYTLANSFNHSNNLKKRITMMLKKKSNPMRCATALYILPAAALTLSLFASPQETVGNNLANDPASTHKSSETFAKSDTVEQKVYHFTENNTKKEKLYRFVPEKADEKVYKVCEIMPQFPGGEKALENHLSMTIDAPTGAPKEKLHNPIVQFVVNTDGSVSNVKVVKSTGNTKIDNILIKYVSIMPKWAPGIQGGKKVKVELTRPFNLKILTNNEQQVEVEKTAAVELTTNNEAYNVCEKMPEFPGGTVALMKFLAENIKYPEDARKEKAEGRAFICFVVKSDGSISDIKVMKSTGNESLDQEAMRVVSLMPKWTPGTQDGEKVNSKFTIPVQFRLK